MKLWAMRTKPLTPKEEKVLLSLLPLHLQKRLRRADGSVRRDSLWAYSLLQYAMQNQYGRELPEILWKAGEKPRFSDCSGLFFNISHTDGAVLVGIAPVEIGVDIEKERPAPARVRKLLQISEEAFFAEWVCREACAKCAGRSIYAVLKEEWRPEKQFFRRVETFPGYQACAAAAREIRELAVIAVEAGGLFPAVAEERQD